MDPDGPFAYTNPSSSPADVYLHATPQQTYDFAFTVESTATPTGTDPPAGDTRYYHTDAIGSVRTITGGSGQLLERHDYLPFGQEWPASVVESRLFAARSAIPRTG